MTIVHLTWGLKIGGSETMLVDIANKQASNARVYIVVVNKLHDESVSDSLNDGVGVLFIDRPVSSRNPWYLVKLYRLLHQLKPDILHSHGEHIVDMIPFRMAPIVATIHDTRVALASSIRKHRGIFVISEAVKHDILTRCPDLSLTVIHNGIDFSGIKRKEGCGGPLFRIVQVSRLMHQKKGQDILLQALRYVNQKIGEGRLTVDFIGDGESRVFLENLAGELDVSQWCGFLGLRTRFETYERLPGYDLLVQPSRYEGFGLTVVEGMAAGLPVLVSDIEGPMEIIDGGRHGFFFRSDDFKDCGDKVIEIMEMSRGPEIARKMGEAYDYAKGRFDIQVTADKYVQEYQKVLSMRNGKK